MAYILANFIIHFSTRIKGYFSIIRHDIIISISLLLGQRSNNFLCAAFQLLRTILHSPIMRTLSSSYEFFKHCRKILNDNSLCDTLFDDCQINRNCKCLKINQFMSKQKIKYFVPKLQ